MGGGVQANGGGHHHHPDDHGHGHDHGHDHDHGHGHEEDSEELAALIKSFGVAVLGKDQESANDVQPTEDHAHLNVQAIIDDQLREKPHQHHLLILAPCHCRNTMLNGELAGK